MVHLWNIEEIYWSQLYKRLWAILKMTVNKAYVLLTMHYEFSTIDFDVSVAPSVTTMAYNAHLLLRW